MSVVTNCGAGPLTLLLLLLLPLLALLLLLALLELLLSPLPPLAPSPEAWGSTHPGGARPAAMRDARKGAPAFAKCGPQETEEPSAQQEKQRRGVMLQ